MTDEQCVATENLAISLLLTNPYLGKEQQFDEEGTGEVRYVTVPDPESSARIALDTAEAFVRLAAERRTT